MAPANIGGWRRKGQEKDEAAMESATLLGNAGGS